jgi:hypothetical protein
MTPSHVRKEGSSIAITSPHPSCTDSLGVPPTGQLDRWQGIWRLGQWQQGFQEHRLVDGILAEPNLAQAIVLEIPAGANQPQARDRPAGTPAPRWVCVTDCSARHCHVDE